MNPIKTFINSCKLKEQDILEDAKNMVSTYMLCAKKVKQIYLIGIKAIILRYFEQCC
jgi:hypothetical protein